MKYRKTNNVGNKFPYTGRSKWVTVHLLGSFELNENFEENLHEITSVTWRCVSEFDEDAFDRDWKNGMYFLSRKVGVSSFRLSLEWDCELWDQNSQSDQRSPTNNWPLPMSFKFSMPILNMTSAASFFLSLSASPTPYRYF